MKSTVASTTTFSRTGWELIPLDQVVADLRAQLRVDRDDDTVADYAELYRAGADLGEITVFRSPGPHYFLADGFHRFPAARLAGLAELPAEVFEGDLRDAIRFALGANHDHGLKRSNADKRKAVATALEDEEWGGWADRRIAELCGVSHTFVAMVRREPVPVPVRLRPEVAQQVRERRNAEERVEVATVATSERAGGHPEPAVRGQPEQANDAAEPIVGAGSSGGEHPSDRAVPAQVDQVGEGPTSEDLEVATGPGVETAGPPSHELEEDEVDEPDPGRGATNVEPSAEDADWLALARRWEEPPRAQLSQAAPPPPIPNDKRATNDAYYTPLSHTLACCWWLRTFVVALDLEDPDRDDQLGDVVEPCVGSGRWVEAVRLIWPRAEVDRVDIDPDSSGLQLDLRDAELAFAGDWTEDQAEVVRPWRLGISNPPYLTATVVRVIERSLERCQVTAMLLRETFTGATGRLEWWRDHPPAFVVKIPERPTWEGPGARPTGDFVDPVLVVWIDGQTDTRFRWLSIYDVPAELRERAGVRLERGR